MTGGHNAIEHIDPKRHRLNKIRGCAHSHQVAGLNFREVGLNPFDYLKHERLGLAHSESADRVSRKIDRDEPLCAFLAKSGIDSPLNDSKYLLRRTAFPVRCALKMSLAAAGPIHRAFHRSIAFELRRWMCNAIVQ